MLFYLFIQPFKKHLLNSYSVPGAVLCIAWALYLFRPRARTFYGSREGPCACGSAVPTTVSDLFIKSCQKNKAPDFKLLTFPTGRQPD